MYDPLKFENVLFKETLCVNTINISPGIKLGLKINLPGTSDNGTLAMTLHFAIETVKYCDLEDQMKLGNMERDLEIVSPKYNGYCKSTILLDMRHKLLI